MLTQEFSQFEDQLVLQHLNRIIDHEPIFKVNSEVAEIIRVSFHDLLDDNNIGRKSITNSYMKETTVPCFTIDDFVIWGATAMILSEIKELLKNIKP